ncbi:Spo0E family sporulation regulatory protein-aspartic acid phosphatase [Sporosarcina sp. FA9]|uniref:Spo0E family sporulation regulatory protein-aspartic acid phosphatase n=1 Tax=Sporosarcina sp. FA9 TaxID=3413030 RepID=UPI003F659C79
MDRLLEIEIESIRKEMIKKALEIGFNNPVTLKISCKLDQLLNQLEKRRRTRMFYGEKINACTKERLEKI